MASPPLARRFAHACMWFIVALVLAPCSESPSGPEPVPHEPVPSPELSFWYLSFSTSCDIGFSPDPLHAADRPILDHTGFMCEGESTIPYVQVYAAGTFPAAVVRLDLVGPAGTTTWTRTFSLASQPGYGTSQSFQEPPWSPPDTGLYVLTATIDPANVYGEIDEANNTASDTMRVDLGFLMASEILLYAPSVTPLAPDTVPAGTPVQIWASVGCRGNFPNVRRVLDVDGTVLLDHRSACRTGYCALPSFQADSLTWFATPGTHRFVYRVDPGNEYPRRDPSRPTTSEQRLVVVP